MIRFDLIWCFEKRAIGLRYVSVLLMTSLFNSIFILNIFEQILHKQFKKLRWSINPRRRGFSINRRGGGFHSLLWVFLDDLQKIVKTLWNLQKLDVLKALSLNFTMGKAVMSFGTYLSMLIKLHYLH